MFRIKVALALLPFLSLAYGEAFDPSAPHVMVLGELLDEELEAIDGVSILPTMPSDDATFQERRYEWIDYFSKRLFEQRLSFRLGDSIHCVFFPQMDGLSVSACALIGEEDEMATLETSLLELRQIALYGITEWELSRAKEEAWELLCNMWGELPEERSVIIQSISTKDIQNYLRPLFDRINQELELTLPYDRETEDDPLLVNLCSTNSNDTAPFYSLPITDSDKKTIYWVIHTIAKNNVIKLGLKQREVRKKAEKIQYLHPFRFLSYVMSEGNLQSDMRTIKKSSWKWNNFMKDFSSRLAKEASRNNLMPYVAGFADSLNIDPKVIESFIQRRDWQGLITYFL